MGLGLEFFAGDSRQIGDALAGSRFGSLRDGMGAVACADFSLHLPFESLDALSETIADWLGVVHTPLSWCLSGPVGPRSQFSGADLVSPSWVKMVASVEESHAECIAGNWFNELEPDEEDRHVPPEVVEAVRSLIHLCKRAEQEGLQVILFRAV
jgi:hypothetical protein